MYYEIIQKASRNLNEQQALLPSRRLLQHVDGSCSSAPPHRPHQQREKVTWAQDLSSVFHPEAKLRAFAARSVPSGVKSCVYSLWYLWWLLTFLRVSKSLKAPLLSSVQRRYARHIIAHDKRLANCLSDRWRIEAQSDSFFLGSRQTSAD